MEKFTTAKNITELETSEEKELRRTEKKKTGARRGTNTRTEK